MNRTQRFTMMAALLPLLSSALFSLSLVLGWPVRIGGGAALEAGAVSLAISALAAFAAFFLLLGSAKARSRGPDGGVENDLFFRGILESSRDALVSFGRSGDIRYANPSAIRLLGLPDNPTGYRWFDLLTPESEARLEEILDSLRQVGSTTEEMQLQAAEADGSARTIALSVVVRMPKNKRDLPYYSALARDVSEVRQLKSKYEETKREAERLGRERALFLARISHEIRTPLQAIVSVIRQHGHSEGTGASGEWLEQIDISAKSLMRTLDDFLDFAKFDAGSFALETACFRLEDSIRRCSRTLQSLIGNKPVRRVVRIDPDLPARIVGDPQRVEQVLGNLLSNAAQHTDRGAIELTVEKEGDHDNGAFIRFSVRDTGTGMPDALLARLFQPFQQADGAGWSGRGGTGLGLVNAKILAERMGGSLDAESRLGSGSLFRFRLPLFPVPELPSSVPHLACRAMVLGSSESSRSLVAALGSFCHAAASPTCERALAAWERGPFHFLIVDARSPNAWTREDWRGWKRECGRRNVKMLVVVPSGGVEPPQLQEGAVPEALLAWPPDPRTWYRILEELAPETGPFPASRGPSPKRGAAARVLLVDDHEISRIVEARMLKNLGCAVTTAESATLAIRLLEDTQSSEKFDLIVMDLHMPEMDGLEAVRRIRRMPHARKLPIALLTADATADRASVREEGVQDVLLKPVEPERLREAIGRLLPDAVLDRDRRVRPEKSWLRERPELNVPAALDRLGGKEELLLHLLRKFRENYADICSVLREDIRLGRRREARRKLHTLRGSAAHLAADALFEAASRLERELGLDGRDAAEHLGLFEDRLGLLLAAIGGMERKYEQSMSNTNKSDIGGDKG
ncbi:ATP-binding protein [Cohnella zeiphila]|uniref:histidine kinase n=1 Tax=Cohnella zeiphila TaxID=2761120 RepID=A0A7X0VTS7_9BACL|nr:ATP-binding protein [Cohnella zeiphila]MBB6730281.1 response regulator [Cohnella zeiphila]